MIRYSTGSQKPFCVLPEGSVFGEYYCLTKIPSPFYYTAVSNSDNWDKNFLQASYDIRRTEKKIDHEDHRDQVMLMCVDRKVLKKCCDVWKETGIKVKKRAEKRHKYFE